jgi:hypothetical protein
VNAAIAVARPELLGVVAVVTVTAMAVGALVVMLVIADRRHLSDAADLATVVADGGPGEGLVLRLRRGDTGRTSTATLSIAPADRS